MRAFLIPALALLVGLFGSRPVAAYSVLTHEAIIDTTWPREIKPLLLKRFPMATEEELREAHAYAYGGAIIQDMGYYPFGSKFFSDLVHYTRSGDFVLQMLADAQNLNEYAFALGSLAHYAADNLGHPIATNRAVPMVYPKLRAEFGTEVTYADNPSAHLKTEFGFDVIQIARGQYASDNYRDFIGFQVSKELLQRSFEQTYSLELKKIFLSLDLALGTYRFSVSSVIPEMTKAAWVAKKDDIAKLQAGMTRQKFIYRFSTSSYNQAYGRMYQRPGFGARFLAWLFRIIPKVGPFRALAFRVPPPEAEKLFLTSVENTLARYRELAAEVNRDRLKLINDNFDTGKLAQHGDYRLADETYDKLLEEFADKPDRMSAPLRNNILAFYGPSGDAVSTKARVVLNNLKVRTATTQLPQVSDLDATEDSRQSGSPYPVQTESK